MNYKDTFKLWQSTAGGEYAVELVNGELVKGFDVALHESQVRKR